jgi:hypothetical protein
MMEYYDAFTLFLSGFALGVIAGSYLKRAERRIERDKGELDAIDRFWPVILVGSAELERMRGRYKQPSTSQGGDGTSSP